MPKSYAKQIITPSYGRVGYGLMTWLNSHNDANNSHAGPNPRWGDKFTCSANSKTCGACCRDDKGVLGNGAHCDLESTVLSEEGEFVSNPRDPRFLLRGASN